LERRGGGWQALLIFLIVWIASGKQKTKAEVLASYIVVNGFEE
jgi:hypothetical protein